MSYLSNDELLRCINDAIAILENYRIFGPMVEEGIAAFKEIKECLIDPNSVAIEKVKITIAMMEKQIGPYKSIVPEIAMTLEKLGKWSKEN